MIAHPEPLTHDGLAQRLVIAFIRMLANRSALYGIRQAQLDDCGISPEMLKRATDWRFWRRVNEPAPWLRQPVARRASRVATSARGMSSARALSADA